jgi:hypothetical protein
MEETMAKKRMETRSATEEWLSLEQAAEVLGLPPATVRRRALDGDAPIPAYQFWDEGNNSRVRFRFRKSDLESFHAPASAQEQADAL